MIIMFVFCFDFVRFGKKNRWLKPILLMGLQRKKNRFHRQMMMTNCFFFALIYQRTTNHLPNPLINNNVIVHEIKWSFKMIFILLDYSPILYGLLMFIVDISYSDASINFRLRPGLVEFYDRPYISFNKIVNLIGFWLNFRKIIADHINCDQWS